MQEFPGRLAFTDLADQYIKMAHYNQKVRARRILRYLIVSWSIITFIPLHL